MLFKILDNIRSKPKYVRDQYALGIAVFCTVAIGGVWSLSLPSRFAGDSQVAALASTTNAAPFTNFFTQLKHQFAGIKDGIKNVPVATTTKQTSASSTESALDLQLSDENKAQIKATETSGQGTKIQFGNGAAVGTTTDTYSQAVIIASSSKAATTTR